MYTQQLMMADLDRLTPSYKSREMVSGRKGVVSPVTCVQQQARSVIRKYRRNVRYSQLRRLKEMIPILAQQGTVDEVRT